MILILIHYGRTRMILLFDESLNSDDSALPNLRVNDTSRTFAIEETEIAGKLSSQEKDTSQNPVGERDEDREESGRKYLE